MVLFTSGQMTKLYALDGQTGTKKWEFATGGDVEVFSRGRL